MLDNSYDYSKIKRYDIINFLSKKYGFKSYLEIGTSNFLNYNKIEIQDKECIDPQRNKGYTYNMTSDDAFKIINRKYDIIFIDGFHHGEQVDRDIKNSLKVLNDNGVIVLHDCNPPTALHARYPPPNPINCPWNGDCYKSIVRFRIENPNIFSFVVDTDWGVGVIDKNLNRNTENIHIPENLLENKNDKIVGGILNVGNKKITWDYFNKNR